MNQRTSGFTIAELLISISIITILIVAGFTYYRSALNKGKVSQAVAEAEDIRRALHAYQTDLGFYPPEVGTGIDPGLTKISTPACSPIPPCDPDTANCCPQRWDANIVQVPPVGRWLGPYVDRWPDKTPWGGDYDYNYWTQNNTARPNVYTGGTCMIPSGGIYIGIQTDTTGVGRMLKSAEQYMIDQGIDADGCVNGEVQILVDTHF